MSLATGRGSKSSRGTTRAATSRGTPPAISAAVKRLAASPRRKASTLAATIRSPLSANSARRCFSSSAAGSGSSGAAAPSITMLCAFTVPALWASWRRVDRDQARHREQHVEELRRVRVVRHVLQRRDVGDDPAVGTEHPGVAQALHRLDRQHHAGRAVGDEIAGDRGVGDAHEGRHRPAPLRHAVHLRLLQVEPRLDRRVVDDLGDGKHALPARRRRRRDRSSCRRRLALAAVLLDDLGVGDAGAAGDDDGQPLVGDLLADDARRSRPASAAPATRRGCARATRRAPRPGRPPARRSPSSAARPSSRRCCCRG